MDSKSNMKLKRKSRKKREKDGMICLKLNYLSVQFLVLSSITPTIYASVLIPMNLLMRIN